MSTAPSIPPAELRRCLGAAEERTLADDVLDGLTRPLKELPPKHFYDARGSELFDRICELEEYYPTRAERAILLDQAPTIARLTGAAELIELGSGYAHKTRVLLDALRAGGTLRRYVPIDVAEAPLRSCATMLPGEYPGLQVYGIVGDFERHLDHLPAPAGARLLALLGGTIGNFLPGSRRRFLRGLGRHMVGEEDHLLLGVDLVKDPRVLEAAYDDAAGVTAAFNRNVLAVINRDLGADFDLDAFEHVAFFDRRHEWIEMRLRSRWAQTVHIPAVGLEVHFAAGEEMRTEISAKFTPARLEADFEAAGLQLVELFTDPDRRFALALAQRAAAAAAA